VRFSLLGPLVVAGDSDDQVVLGGPRLRVLLAALLLRAGVPVPADELAEVMWDGSPPLGATSTLRSYVRRLRRALGDDGKRIIAHDPGYLIHAQRQELDVLQFEALCGHARAALRTGEWDGASAAAQDALRLWRATPLLDIPSEALREEFVPRLERLRLQALEVRFDAGLQLGQHQELVPQLLDMTAQYPLQERFRAQLMLALATTGRRAQALQAYQEARRILIDELGIEPGPELRDLHQRILADDADTAGLIRVPSAESAARALAGPAQLPADIADYTGREAKVSALSSALTGDDRASGPGVVRVVVIAGAAGVGKTTLAVHGAHQVRSQFPDGQLFVQLAGASAHPAVPGDVLARLLRDLGVDGDKVPAGTEERAALYRTQLATRRVLILLDDARDAAQVRPLLPGSASCTVVVTTRSSTPHLLGTAFVGLDTLPGSEALELFSRIVGDARPVAEPEAAAEILRACAGLPLAIRICAARLATRPRWRIATMAALLRDEHRRLDELQVGDLEVRASFQVSYDSLKGNQSGPARIFRMLGLWQGQRISLPAVAALAGQQERDIAGALETLIDMNLLESPEPGWYQLHDLLRLFAAEQAQAEESEEAQAAAVARLVQWYLSTATAIADQYSPNRYRLPGEQPPPGLVPGSTRNALDWYDREHANLVPAIRQAAAAGLHDAAWRLPTTLYPFYNRLYHWADCIAAHRIAVTSARLAGSRAGEAWALYNLGYGLARLGDTEAFARIQEAAAIRREMGDLGGEARAAIATTEAHLRIHGPQAAYEYSLRSLELLREVGDPGLLSIGLNNHGDVCISLGKIDEATECLQEALGILTAIGGGVVVQGHVLQNLGNIYLESGRLPEALASLAESHRHFLEHGHLPGQAQALKYLGRAQHSAGQPNQARESLEAALRLFRNQNDTAEIAYVQSALATLEHPAEPGA
jgi:DNA-binding SARP family transcriptional activator